MERLTALADAFLAAEDVDPASSLVIGSLAVFDGPAPEFEEFLELAASRLPLVPRYRQRLRPPLLGLAAPAWVDDNDFDLRRHVLRAAVPAPGGDEEVDDLIARLMAPRMDRSRPLWECWVCEGLPEGRWATLSRVHHCLADGVSGMDLYRLFLDAAPTVPPPPPDDWAPEVPPAREQETSALRELAGVPARVAGTVARAARTPVRSAQTVACASRGLLDIAAAGRPVHPTSLVGPIGRSRHYRSVTVDLGDVRRLRAEAGATVNDVVLCAITGGFQRLLISRGEEPHPRAIRSLVPVSTRAPGDEANTDNQVSLLLPFLPVEVADPLERLDAVRRRLRRLRAHHEPEGGTALTGAGGLAPWPPVSWWMHAALRLPQPWVSTVTTNVPGPREPRYCLGRELRSLHPWVPIADRVRIGIAIVSYRDHLTFGITGDRETTPDLDVLAEGIAESWSELGAR